MKRINLIIMSLLVMHCMKLDACWVGHNVITPQQANERLEQLNYIKQNGKRQTINDELLQSSNRIAQFNNQLHSEIEEIALWRGISLTDVFYTNQNKLNYKSNKKLIPKINFDNNIEYTPSLLLKEFKPHMHKQKDVLKNFRLQALELYIKATPIATSIVLPVLYMMRRLR